ncbi:MAG TPA: hypothetical protein VFD82_17935 [Planctomycetota bacterium]|nr:hypothetical protein [Planctomycetota bacterium]
MPAMLPIVSVVTALSIAGSIAGLLGAQSPLAGDATADPTVAAAWTEFQREAGSGWLVQWNAATGTPRAIYGAGLTLADWRHNDLDEARRHAWLQLMQRDALLGVGASELRERIAARMGRTWTFTFDQWFRGLPVLGGRVDVRMHMRGALVHLGSTLWPIPADFDTRPAFGEELATGAAWLALGLQPSALPQPGRPRTTRLVLRGDADAQTRVPCVLAWEVPISAVDAAGNGPIGFAYVDARTGAYLGFTNDKHVCGPACAVHGGGAGDAAPGSPAAPPPATYTVMGWTHTGFSPVSAPTNIPLAGVEVVVPGVGTLITDLNGQFIADLTSPTAVTVALNGVHNSLVQGPSPLSAAATLQPGVAATLQFGTPGASEFELAHTTCYHWTWRINEWARSILGNTPELAVADNVLPTVNIASTCNAFYTGNSINFYGSGGGCNNTCAASVIAHEWGHGLDDRYGGISQVNGLSEGWGDICSMYLLDDPTIGHDFFNGGGGLRSGNNTQQYPNGSGPHDQGLSWMGFAWKFRQILRTALGPTQALAISNDVVLGSIVANASNQPSAVLAVFQADDDDGQLGNGTPHYTELRNACQQHSLPYPPLSNGYLLHTQLANTWQQGTPRRIDVDAIPFAGSFAQVRVHWFDGAWHQRNLIPSGAPNGWQGLLPGQFTPNTTTYHVEALHTLGSTHRLPATGEWAYLTLAEHRIWFEDFENGGAGWTHGAISGTDDWEVGAPAGRSGAGWVDAGAAASGTQCAGTDLGATTDGAYAAASATWLRTPPIDCTGFSGVRMRIKRWVSCAGPTDRVEVRVNGSLVWTNSFTLLHDTGWSTREFVLTSADNQPNVVVEFRLISSGPFQYGGWNLDDVEIYTLAAPVPLAATLRVLPEQVVQGSAASIQIGTPPLRPFVLVLGDTAGPTTVPGIPTVQVGGAGLSLYVGATDAAGQFTLPLVVPSAPPTGTWLYSQVLTLDASLQLIVSNPFVNLFTQ